MNNYIKYIFKAPVQKQQIVLGWLSQYEFEAFEEKEDALHAYIDEAIHGEELPVAIQSYSNQMGIPFEIEKMPTKNWNAVWESNFEPILVDSFCYIKAPFHPDRSDITHTLAITPKMAFGTGHHATTYMMIQLMEDLDFEGKSIFDYGCGTGVLAILAAKLGAKELLAIDIDVWATENTREHIQHNQVNPFSVQTGDLSIVTDQSFDVILANINRNVIIESLPRLKFLLHEKGTMLISGILTEDLPLVKKALHHQSLAVLKNKCRGDWTALRVGHLL